MASRRRTGFDDRGLVIDGPEAPPSTSQAHRRLPFYAGAMHYWRVEPAAWPACLAAMAELGLRLVETYVPWRVHEIAATRHDFAGPRDLAKFLDAAAAAGLGVVLRPGPHVNAELTAFGLPDRVLRDPACQARTAAGTPAWLPVPPRAFPVPSYASARFRDEVRAWYGVVAGIVAPRLAPDGPVVAIGVDNEAQMFFRTGAFDVDYHPDAIAWWREECAAIGIEPGEPPRQLDTADVGRAVAWVRFKDRYLARALGEFAAMLDEVGLGEVARFHNLPPGEPWLYDLPAVQTAIAGPVGFDVYSPRAELGAARRRALHVAGSAAPVPLVLESGVGFFPWFPPLDRDDDPDRARDQLLTVLSAGVRGFNLFMAVERDRYYGAAIDRRGRPEAEARWIRTLIEALDAVDWPSLRRMAPVALVASRADTRFGHATSLLDPMTPVVLEVLGLGPAGTAEAGTDDDAIEHRRWFAALERALALAGVPYAIVDEGCPVEQLAAYRAVVVPTLARIDRGLAANLRRLDRKTTIVMGPGTPARDELDRPLGDDVLPRRFGRIRPGSLDDLPGLAEDLAALAGEAPEAWTIERVAPGGAGDASASVFADAAGNARVVFVTSDATQAVTATLSIGTARALRDPFAADPVPISDGRVRLRLRPHGVRMLIVD